MVTAPGHCRLVTHIFARGDSYLDRDAVFRVTDSLVVDYARAAGRLGPVGRAPGRGQLGLRPLRHPARARRALTGAVGSPPR